MRSFCVILLMLVAANIPAETCTYSSYNWNVRIKKAVEFKKISKSFADLLPYEIHSKTGCTVCSEDQKRILVDPYPEFLLCKKIAKKIEDSLIQLAHKRNTIFKIKGYQVGFTRGPVDADGNRTLFSNHSFGVAIDINPEQNGLYDNCENFGPACRLLHGGPWLPGQPGTLLPGGSIVQTFLLRGFKWGGNLVGKQKDFMHFSHTGN